MPTPAYYTSTSPLSVGGGQLPSGYLGSGPTGFIDPYGDPYDPHKEFRKLLQQPFRPRSERYRPPPRVPNIKPYMTPKELNYLRKYMLMLPRMGRWVNPYGRAFDFLGNNPFWNPFAPYGGPGYTYNGPGSFRECHWSGLDWAEGAATFLVDAGDTLGADLTCLSGQAIFSSNFDDAPSNHRNLWLMRKYWIAGVVGRTASMWVRHIDAGPPPPYPLPEPIPFGAPSDEPSQAPNPFDPDAGDPLAWGPDPMPRPWGDPDTASGSYGEPNNPIKPPRERYRRIPGKGTKEDKIDAKGAIGALVRIGSRVLGGFTEFMDFVEAFWDALPKDIRRMYGSRIQDKIEAVFDHWDAINYKVALVNLAVNHLEDKAIGRFMQFGPKGQQIARKNGYWSSDLVLTKRWNPPS